MPERITLTLPSGVYRRVEAFAKRSGRSMGELLAETIELTLSPLEESSDEDVLKATAVTMAEADDRRLSELLGLQRESALTQTDRAELTDLMGLYERMLLRKAKALQEAVRRGLRGPLEP
jgi:predicted DNA-binding protein